MLGVGFECHELGCSQSRACQGNPPAATTTSILTHNSAGNRFFYPLLQFPTSKLLLSASQGATEASQQPG